jgi:hypothetical protein
MAQNLARQLFASRGTHVIAILDGSSSCYANEWPVFCLVMIEGELYSMSV